MRNHFWVVSAVLLMGVFLYADAAQAADAGGVLDGIAEKFVANASSWSTKILQYAERLFYLLALITFVWQFVPLAASGFKGDLGDVFGPLLRWIITTGLFYFLLEHGAEFAGMIIQSFMQIGGDVAGKVGAWYPSRIIDIGFALAEKVMMSVGKLGVMDRIATGSPLNIVTILVLLIMTLVAAQVLIIYAGAYIMAYAGIIVLGFGGSHVTRDMAIAYYKHMIGIGLHLMTMFLILGIGINEIESMANAIKSSDDLPKFGDILAVGVASLVMYLLMSRVPTMVASLAGGGGASSGLTGGIVSGIVGGAVAGLVNNTVSAGSMMSQLMKAVRAGGEDASAIENLTSMSKSAGTDVGSNLYSSNDSVMSLPGQENAGTREETAASASSTGAASRIWAGTKSVGTVIKSVGSAVGTQIVTSANRRTAIGKVANVIRDSTAAKEKIAKIAADANAVAALKEQIKQFSSQPLVSSDSEPEDTGGGSVKGGKT